MIAPVRRPLRALGSWHLAFSCQHTQLSVTAWLEDCFYEDGLVDADCVGGDCGGAGVMAIRPVIEPVAVRADSETFSFYIEPGVQMLRYPDGSGQVYGKVDDRFAKRKGVGLSQRDAGGVSDR